MRQTKIAKPVKKKSAVKAAKPASSTSKTSQLFTPKRIAITVGLSCLVVAEMSGAMIAMKIKPLAANTNQVEAATIVPDVTSKLVTLGTPYASYTPYARNAWDLELFNNKLYAGGGNSANSGPSLRPGPIPIYSLDPTTKQIVKEYTTNEDQINSFLKVNGNLTVPGHDPREGQDKGNYYTLSGATWVKTRTIPSGIHTYDMKVYGGKLFAALGTDATKATIVQSTNNGATWTSALDSPFPQRVYNLFTFKSELYASAVSYPDVSYFNGIKQIMKYNGTKFIPISNAPIAKMYPGYPTSSAAAKMISPVESTGSLFYIGGTIDNDHGTKPFGLYTTTTVGTATKVPFADAAAQPYDMLTYNNYVNVLTNTRQADGTYRVRIYSRTPATGEWREVLNFSSPTLARSFTRTSTNFYVGLGTTTEDLSTASGRIYKIAI